MPDPAGAIAGALARPMGLPALSLFVEPGDRVVVVVDAEAEAAWQLVLPAVVGILRLAGAASTRLHLVGEFQRDESTQAWERLVADLAAQPDGEAVPLPRGSPFEASPPAAPGDHLAVGKVPGLGTVRLDRFVATADKLVLVGALTLHPLAGFGGGGLLLAYGCGDATTKQALLARARVDATKTVQQGPPDSPDADLGRDTPFGSAGIHPLARSGIVEGNPIQETAASILDLVAPAFLVELAFQRGQKPAGVFAGGVREAHRAAVAFHRRWHGGPQGV